MALTGWRQRVRQLKAETFALYLAARHPRTPWYAKVFGLCVVAYALSPIDLVPDFIPVVGYLDDLLLVPLGLILARRMIPAPVLTECRAQAADTLREGVPANRWAAAVIVGIWILAAAIGLLLVARAVGFDLISRPGA